MRAACSRPQAVAAVSIRLRMSLIAEILGLAVDYARSAATAAIPGDIRTLAVRLRAITPVRRRGNRSHQQARVKRRTAMEDQTDERDIELHFERTNFFTRWPCTFCGGTTEKVAMLCEGEGLRACEQCLEAGQDQLDERLRKTADACEVQSPGDARSHRARQDTDLRRMGSRRKGFPTRNGTRRTRGGGH